MRERATAFWEARVKGDWGTVYDFLSEDERAAGTKEQYIAYSTETGPFHYLSYKLGDIEVQDNVGWVKIAFDLEPTRFPGLRPMHVDGWELWEKRDGKWYPIPKQRVEEWPKLPPSLRSVKEESTVAARANEFWQAREKNDYASVYKFCSPMFREKMPAEEFMSKKAQNSYVGHRIHWAEVTGDHAKVRVTFDYRPNDPNMTKATPSQETIVQQWVKVNNQWYLDVNVKD